MEEWTCPACGSDFVYGLENDDFETVGGQCLDCEHQWTLAGPTEVVCDQCDQPKPLLAGVTYQAQDHRGFWVTVGWLCAECATHPQLSLPVGTRVVPTRELADAS